MKTSKTNLGYLFTKDYFRLEENNYKIEIKNNEELLVITNVEERSKVLLESVLDTKHALSDVFKKEAFHTFELTTIYPGLLVGSGYMHDIKSEKAFKLGFSFDHTTGLPVIPGSSVKGLLRSAFRLDGGGYVKEVLEGLEIRMSEEEIRVLEKHIFDSTEDVSVYRRDKFFDAFPVATNHRGGHFLADDYITPHPNPLKDPKPIRFLKVGPGVTFRFVFELYNFEGANGQCLSAEQKLLLFQNILLDLGIGAKTNVGYGQFKGANKGKPFREEQAARRERTKGDLHSGAIVEAKVVDLSSGVKVDLGIKGIPFQPRLAGLSPKNFSLGQIIKVRVEIDRQARYKFTYIEEL